MIERVARLEKLVEDLQRTVKQLTEPLPGASPGDSLEAPAAETAEVRPGPGPEPPLVKPVGPAEGKKKAFFSPEALWTKSEFCLNKIGIGLILFGVAFLFKYSIDKGWLVPPARVGAGMVIGLVLLVTGIRTHATRRHFSQVLLGGAVATFYITGFAAFQLYALVSHPMAFAFMVAVTLAAFFLSIRQNEAVLSLIGAIGGLGTPFLLYTDAGSLPGLAGYTCLILAGTSVIYFFRGWRSLLWISVIGGWLVFLISSEHAGGDSTSLDRWAVQLGIVFSWLAFWTLPVIRDWLQAKNPDRWASPSRDFSHRPVLDLLDDFLQRATTHLLVIILPFAAWGVSSVIWRLPSVKWGWIVLGGSLVYGLAFGVLRTQRLARLAYTHGLLALALLTIAFCLLLEGDVLFLILTVEATALHLVSWRLSDRGTAVCAHLLFGVLAVWLAGRLVGDFTFKPDGTAILNARAVTDLAVIAAGLGLTKIFRTRDNVMLYRIAAHLAILGWFLRELSAFDNGQAYVTSVWGIYAVVLLILALRKNLSQLRTVAMGTLLLVVGKLFLVDLSRLEAIWRILLFLCFGGVFLVLSYYFKALWKPGSDNAADSPES